MELVTQYDIILAFLGCLLFSVSLHYKQKGKEIEYAMFGYAANLTVKGKTLYFIGLAMVLFGAISSVM